MKRKIRKILGLILLIILILSVLGFLVADAVYTEGLPVSTAILYVSATTIGCIIFAALIFIAISLIMKP